MIHTHRQFCTVLGSVLETSSIGNLMDLLVPSSIHTVQTEGPQYVKANLIVQHFFSVTCTVGNVPVTTVRREWTARKVLVSLDSSVLLAK